MTSIITSINLVCYYFDLLPIISQLTMYTPGVLCKRLLRRCTLNRFLSTSGVPAVEEKIEIPLRIPRGPTDILRALESTITRDPTAAHYKYHDDPYLLPMNNLSKRSYAMAQEAGRKAAHWVRAQHPDLFNHKECVPPIEMFFPKMVYTEKSDVTEDDLKRAIETNQVSDAIFVNSLLNKKGIAVSNEMKQSLLELLCFNNSEDPLNEEFIEERWFRQSSKLREKQRKTWKDSSIAEEIFVSIDNPTREAYSALIQGMGKFYQAERALQLFEEAKEKNFLLPVESYNAVIKVANFLKDSYEMRWSFVINLLQEIKQAGLKPNLGTLNAVLYTLSSMGTSKWVKECCLKTVNEFKALGVEPSLGSWYYVLITFCKERGPKSGVLSSILSHVEHKDHTIRDLVDTNFFATAMDIANYHLNNVDLGERVHRMLLQGNNYNLIGDSYKESIYYRNYFLLLLNNVPFDDFIEKTYNPLVPHIYVPEPSVMKEVLNLLEVSGGIDHIPRLWSDMVIFNLQFREDLVALVLRLMVDNEPLDKNPGLAEQFGNIAWDIYMTVENQDAEKYNTMQLNGETLGRILTLLLRCDRFENASTVMDKLNTQHQSIVGVPDFGALSLFVDHCIKNKAPSKAIICIQYASDCGFPDVITLGAKLNEKLTLDENHLDKLSKSIDLRLS